MKSPRAPAPVVNSVKKYVPKKITEAEIQEIQFFVNRANFRVGMMSPGISPHFKRMFKLATDDGDDSVAAQQIINEMTLLLIRRGYAKLNDPRIKKVLKQATANNDKDYFHKLSHALKSPAEFHITPTELFLTVGWARGSFTFTDNDSFPPLVLFTVKDLTRLIQVVFETNGVTESSLEAIIGRKLMLKTIKHCKVTTAQADKWIQHFTAYKANHSARIKDRYEMWGAFLNVQELLNLCCIKVGKDEITLGQARAVLEYFRNLSQTGRETLRQHFRGKHSDTGGK